jgi:hypothetical protein
MRQVRQRLQQDRPLTFGRFELDLELLDLLAARLAGFVELLDVLPLALGARDLIARRVLLALQTFDLRNQAPAMRFRRGELLQLGRHAEAAAGHGSLHGF